MFLYHNTFIFAVQELENLFPNKSFHITMFGTDITRKLHNQSISYGSRLKFEFKKGLYHTLQNNGIPDLVIGKFCVKFQPLIHISSVNNLATALHLMLPPYGMLYLKVKNYLYSMPFPP